MKIKLKKNRKLSRWDSFSGFSTEDFDCLNSGGTVEVDSVPEIAKELVEEVGQKSSPSVQANSKKENK